MKIRRRKRVRRFDDLLIRYETRLDSSGFEWYLFGNIFAGSFKMRKK